MSAAMGGSVRRAVDVTQTMRATLASNPQITQATFQEMVDSIGFLERYPGTSRTSWTRFAAVTGVRSSR